MNALKTTRAALATVATMTMGAMMLPAAPANAADQRGVTTIYAPEREPGRVKNPQLELFDKPTTGLTHPANWPSNLIWRDYASLPALPAPYNGLPVQLTDGATGPVTVDFKTLPLHLALVRVHGKGTRKIAVFLGLGFSAIKNFEVQLNALDDVTIYTFPFSAPQNEKIVDQIMCQPTPQARAIAYEKAVFLGEIPPPVAPCDSGVKKMISVMKTHKRMNGEPFLSVPMGIAVEKNNMLIDLRAGGIPTENWSKIFAWRSGPLR